jgi:predicted glycoside hydrolase/deacetylase ChbG (UPF0249 family)
MRRLIVNADDFGRSPGVNEGILEAHVNGIVTSASLMVDEPGAGAAAALAGEHPQLSVGLHFVEPEGVDLDDPAQAQRTFAAQLERFRSLTGRDPTHVDSHHHVHASAARMKTFSGLVSQLGVPLRHDGQLAYIGGFYAQWEYLITELRYVSRRFLVHLVATEVGVGFTELACHPARIVGDFDSSYLHEREVELATLTEPGLRDELEALGVSLASFHGWSAAVPARLG